MPLLASENFYTVTFLPTTNAAWAALAPSLPSGITGALAEAIYKAVPTAITIYVTYDAAGNFAFEGGAAYGFDDSLVVGTPTPLATYTLTAADSTTTIWGDDGSGTLLLSDQVTGTLPTSSGAAVGGLQSFIAAV